MLYQLSFEDKYCRLESELLDNYFFLYPLGHLAPFLTYLVVLPLTHLLEYKDLVVSPRPRVNSAIFGIIARISVNSFCSFAFWAASAAAATRAASIAAKRATSAAASLAS